MKILHISALPVWSMAGKGGMPSLRETLRGHLAAGFEIEMVLPKYDLFSDSLEPLPINPGHEFRCHVADCRWLPAIKRMRNAIRRISGSDARSCLALIVVLMPASLVHLELNIRVS